MVSIPARDGRWVKPGSYVCYKAAGTIDVDGKLNEPSWKRASWTGNFIDIEGNDVRPVPRFGTKAMMLWDDECLHVAADLEEPDVWGTLTKRDSVICDDNDFEVFIKPFEDSPSYFEFEFNALNTVWDLFLNKAYYQGGTADISWDCKGLKHAVQVDGTLNWPLDIDRGWTIEISIPWTGLDKLGINKPPKSGDQWRVNFSRVEWERQLVGKYCDNWTWSNMSEINMHIPDYWGIVQFSDIVVGTGEEAFVEKPRIVKPWWESFDPSRLPPAPDRSYLQRGRMRYWEEMKLKASPNK